ncbi:MAG: chitobiase/beta-hexosaminidase C-terminal domain-containing protein, partial [Bacteroidota bacterium]
MRKITFLKTMLAAVMLLVGSSGLWGQATLPFTYDLGKPTAVTGLTQTTLGTDYSASPKMKFDTSGDNLILFFNAIPGTLSYNLKWNQSAAAARFPGDFVLLESANGTDYTVVQQYNSTAGPALANGTVVSETITTLLTTTRYLKWEYTTKSNGNIALGLISLTEGVSENTVKTPMINVSGNMKTTDTYFNSAEISLSSNTADAAVYYTTNGTEPTVGSTLFTAPFTITSTTTVKAFAVKAAMDNSPVAERTITIVPPATATVPYTEAFNNSLGDWYAYQVAGAKPWVASANGAYGNGIGGGDVESWLISPLFTSPLAGLAFSFNYASKYIGNPISVKVSQNYIGYGSPTAATWTELTTIAAPTVRDDAYTVKASGDIIAPLSGNLHFALVYDYISGDYSDWRITNASLVVAPAPNTPTITITEVNMPAFKAIVGRKDTADIHVSAVNLTADVSLVISGTDAAKFAVSPATLAHTSGTVAETLVHVIYQPDVAGTHTATLTISSAGATSKVYELSGTAFVATGAGTVDSPFTVDDVKSLNNALAAGPKYWVAGYIIGVPSA